MKVLHQPVVPGDLLFLKQMLFICKYYIGELSAGAIAAGMIALVMFSIRKKMMHFSLPWHVRIAVILSSILFVFHITKNYKDTIKNVNARYKITNEFWEQVINYKKNGVLYSFLMNLESLKVNKPDVYTKNEIEKNVSIFYDSTLVQDTVSDQDLFKPNIIMYMSESFWDIKKIPSIKFKNDPIKTYRGLVKKGNSINLVSPTFGGNTCDAEFEVLTGMSNRYFPTGARAYSQYIHRSTPSMVSVLKENGYSTTAIHTFQKWFWNRNNIYRYFGFENFIGLEDLKDPEIKGYFVADKVLSDAIITQAKTQKAPYFIFALSMQNHGPYSQNRYKEINYPVNTGFSAQTELEINNYTQGISDADASLKMIIDFIKKEKKPTIVVFFGDHLPAFTHIYDETGYLKSQKGELTMHTTTAVFYANFKLKKFPQKLISMSYLPLVITGQTGVRVPPYYTFLKTKNSKYPVLSRNLVFDSTGQVAVDIEDVTSFDNTSWLFTYDLLFGKQYAQKYHHLIMEPLKKDTAAEYLTRGKVE
jgi:phosphoglycerol transferase MdoB-like AlkP superfamily enzyme